MVVDELLRLQDITEETLSWTRPNFFALRYELAGLAGPVARVSVNGIGSARHVLAELAESALRIDLFPLQRQDVPILRMDETNPIAIYHRSNPVQVRFAEGGVYEFRTESAFKTVLQTLEAQPVFTLEQVEAFPRWRVEMKLKQDAYALGDLPVLLAAACCFLVFP